MILTCVKFTITANNSIVHNGMIFKEETKNKKGTEIG